MSFVRDKIVEWFTKNANMSQEDIKSKLYNNYFDEGWIDSFSFINFISDMEKEFSISFSNEEFQEKTFTTISGLTKIIKEKQFVK